MSDKINEFLEQNPAEKVMEWIFQQAPDASIERGGLVPESVNMTVGSIPEVSEFNRYYERHVSKISDFKSQSSLSEDEKVSLGKSIDWIESQKDFINRDDLVMIEFAGKNKEIYNVVRHLKDELGEGVVIDYAAFQDGISVIRSPQNLPQSLIMTQEAFEELTETYQAPDGARFSQEGVIVEDLTPGQGDTISYGADVGTARRIALNPYYQSPKSIEGEEVGQGDNINNPVATEPTKVAELAEKEVPLPLGATNEEIQPIAKAQVAAQFVEPVEPETEQTTSPSAMPVEKLSALVGQEALLAVGSSGPEVEELQAFLAEHGYDTGVVDGKMGEKTATALKQFQTGQQIEGDGIVGPDTLASMRQTNVMATLDLNGDAKLNVTEIIAAGLPVGDGKNIDVDGIKVALNTTNATLERNNSAGIG